MSISFENPPINEVAIGKSFQSQTGFLIPYYGRFWELVEDDFPICKHAAPILDRPDNQQIRVETVPAVPRVWLLNADETRLLQLQQDRFYYNWRQTDKKETYQRFVNIYDEYRKYSGLLPTFFEGQLGTPLVTKQYHLTYVNLFRKGVEWNVMSDINELFKHICFPHKVGYGDLIQSHLRLEYDMADNDGKIIVTLAPATVAYVTEPVVRMEIAASSPRLDEKPLEEDVWFHKAHDAIINGFCDLTSDKAQTKLWKRIK